MNLVRVRPVHFQSLEQEIETVARYLSGRVLNAGCGRCDITAYLRLKGVSVITRYDMASDAPEVILGPLESMPFADESFDSALCNVALEHVVDAERAIRELARVVRKGGHVVVAVPFLQPYHPSPGDFRRYTADGLAALGRQAGLDVIELLPVHSMAQTIGSILWESASEKRGRIRRAAVWALTWLWTRISHRTDRTLAKNAKPSQAVFRRPEPDIDAVRDGAWRLEPEPASSANVPTMLMPDELRLLHHAAEYYYSGSGAIIDAGCFLGGSTVALADGLRRNARASYAGPGKPIQTFDRFEVEDWTRGLFFPADRRAGSSFRNQFDCHVAPYADLVEVHAGDVSGHPWTAGPIEILFLDLAKHWTVCDWVTWQWFPHLIPGRSLVVQQDYLYHQWNGWLHVTMEFYAEYFEYVCDTGLNSVVFRNTRFIPASVLRRNTVASLTTAAKSELMMRAADRFTGARREIILAARTHFLEILAAP
jgi:SAM-dependent methyltransferase